MDRQKRHLLVQTILLLLIIFVGDIVSGAIGIASPAATILPSGICTISNQGCGPIQFDQTGIANSTANSNLLTSTSLTPLTGETMVVTVESLLGDTVVSMKDTAQDAFTKAFENTEGCAPTCQRFSIWTGLYNGASSVSNIITTTFSNVSIDSQNLILVSTYKNVASVGNATGTTGVGTTGSFQITTEKSGSWIVGGMDNGGVAGAQTCAAIAPTPGTGLKQRIFGCSIQEFPGHAILGDLEDNSTALINNTVFTYSESWPINTSFNMGAIELIASDQEPNNPNFNNFCTTINGLCVTTQYSLNLAGINTKATGNQAILPSTEYCTGLTSLPITTTSNHPITAGASFGGNDRNITEASVVLQLIVTTTAPPTTFGTCAASGTVGSATLNWAANVGTGAANSEAAALTGYCTSVLCPTGTYYATVVMTAYNFGAAGHMLWLSSLAQTYSFGSIWIMEVK